ncbi:MAG: methyltransferase domain-containing protein [Bdellovibrionales bacterium]
MISTKILQGLSLARTGVYFLESLPLMAYHRLAYRDLPPPQPDEIRILWKHILDLHKDDIRNVEKGLYSWNLIDIENPLQHMLSYGEVLRDGLRVALRMKKRQTKDLGATSSSLLSDLPEYYLRNFHFQTDGYLSERSAKRYDHQVEILFNGTAGAMRRAVLPPLVSHALHPGRILEMGSGAGSTTRYLAETFPNAKITAMDLSAPYLKVAQRNLKAYPRIDFVQGDVTNTQFKDESFDAVVSVYLLHELPDSEREKLIREAWRLLKPGGILVLADSLQWDDTPDLNWALDRFPKIYHEPFYKNYVQSDLAKTMGSLTKTPTQQRHALFTKVVWTIKPDKLPRGSD